MADHQRWERTHHVEPEWLAGATPPRRPAPMPRQTLEFWSPRLLILVLLTPFKAMLRPRLAVQRAPAAVNADEPR
jgi:hypothetical protein